MKRKRKENKRFRLQKGSMGRIFIITRGREVNMFYYRAFLHTEGYKQKWVLECESEEQREKAIKRLQEMHPGIILSLKDELWRNRLATLLD